MAPGVIEGTHYNAKADVYSFGILMYEVVTDSVPYPLLENRKLTQLQFANKVVYENYRPQFTVPVKKSIQNLIEKCWSKNPQERPTFEEIFKKLAYNIEDSIDDIYDDEPTENKYYLDDIDIDEVVSYADDINDQNSSENVDVSAEIEKAILPLKEENESLKMQLNEIRTENDQLKKSFNKKIESIFGSLKQENQKLKDENDRINSRLLQLEKRLNELSVPKKIEPKEKSILFKFKENEFDGILNYLNNNFKKDLNNVLEITSSGKSSGHPLNVIDYTKNNYFFSDNNFPSWICFDFKKHKIIPTHYVCKSFNCNPEWSHPKSWVIEVSDTGTKWKTIDEQKDCPHLRGALLVHSFPINNDLDSQSFRYLRIRLTDKTLVDTNYLVLVCFELYGEYI